MNEAFIVIGTTTGAMAVIIIILRILLSSID